MSKKKKIAYLTERISYDIEAVNVLLEMIASDRTENLIEVQILAGLALLKSKEIDKNNDKIDTILYYFDKPRNAVKPSRL